MSFNREYLKELDVAWNALVFASFLHVGEKKYELERRAKIISRAYRFALDGIIAEEDAMGGGASRLWGPDEVECLYKYARRPNATWAGAVAHLHGAGINKSFHAIKTKFLEMREKQTEKSKTQTK